jgi:peptidyl-prolyl cis-trans isomerase B (cyclophilin B)
LTEIAGSNIFPTGMESERKEVAMSRIAGICIRVLSILPITLALAGCSRSDAPPAIPAPKAPAAPVVHGPAPGKVVPAQPVSRRLQRLFKEAVTLDPPRDQLCPPARTFAGKNVVQIFEAVAGKNFEGGLWDQVEFLDAQGRRLKYHAIVKTDLGEIVIDLFPEAAPNHVTNFIALARAGYYDGLPFHASRRVSNDQQRLGYLEGGCPRGTGEKGYGSVGYWLEPETDNTLIHEVGTVGAFHEPEQTDTAACRFYITLTPMPGMDRVYTIFGKVTRGLDVLETINRRPVVDEDPFDRPRDPVIIRSVMVVSE